MACPLEKGPGSASVGLGPGKQCGRKLLGYVQLFVTPRTGAPQAPLSMDFSRQE